MKSTTRFSKNKRGIECLNCKQPISDSDNFCSNCGQVNDLKPISIEQFFTEFFSGFFSFDTRFFNTFVPLLFKPGKVSKEYIEGKRKKYVNPFQLYLNVTIVFFLLMGLFSALDEYTISDTFSVNDNEKNLDINYTANSQTDSTQIEIMQQKLSLRMDSIFNNTNFLKNFKSDSISKEKKDSMYTNFQEDNVKFITSFMVNDWKKIYNVTDLTDFALNYTEKVFKKNDIVFNPPTGSKISFNEKDLKWLFGEKIGNRIIAFIDYNKEHKNATAAEAMTDLNYEKTRWNAFYYKTAQNFNSINDPQFAKAYGNNLLSKTSIALFFLLPIFTLFLSLLYIRRKWNYTEHLVFVFNVQTVFFLLLILFLIFDRLLDTDIGIGLFFPVFLFYLFKALRNFYEQHWFKTTIKFLLLNSVYFILSVFGFVAVAFIAFIL